MGLDYDIIDHDDRHTAGARFSLDGGEAGLHATMSDDYPPSSSGRARLSLSYGDTTFEAYAREGETPHLRVKDDSWGDTVDGYSGEPISDEAIEDWNDAAEAVEFATGDVNVHAGTEVFYSGGIDWKEERASEDRIQDGIDYDVDLHSNTSRVEGRGELDEFEQIIATYEPELAPVVEHGAIEIAWEQTIDAYEDEEFLF